MFAIEREAGFDQHTLTGHSQGTLIASAVAANQLSSVAGLVLLAGMGLPGRESQLDQHTRICQAEGMSDDDIRPSLTQKKALLDILLDTQTQIDAGMPGHRHSNASERLCLAFSWVISKFRTFQRTTATSLEV
jgi:predicted esterase